MENRDQVQTILDESALCVVTMEPDDIQALGSILNNFDTVNQLVRDQMPKPWIALSSGLKGIAEQMALFEVEDPDKALEELGKGISLLQETRCITSEDSSDLKRLQSFLVECPYLNFCSDGADSWPKNLEQSTRVQPAPQDLSQDRELIESFIQESLEHLGTIEIHVLELEKDPDNLQLVDAIFRPFHTIKGVSGFLNLMEINKLAHQIETVLDDARSKKIPVSPNLVDIVLDGVDLVIRLIDDIRERINTGRCEPEILNLEPFLERLRAIAEVQEEDLSGEIETSVPECDGNDVGEILVKTGVVQAEDLQMALEKQASGESAGKRIGEILISEKKAKAKDVAQALRKQKSARQPPAAAGGDGTGGFIKVDTLKLDNMVDMVGELVINEAVIKQRLAMVAGKDRDLAGDLAQLSRITSEIQRLSMSMRMIPMKSTFQKMIRLVRDLSNKAGKKVKLQMMGEDTEIDRNMVDMIYDPLVHMVRNSADHGIEKPEDRLAAGKPETGTIILNAFHKGGNMIIEVTDDGLGLDKKALVAKAIEKGVIQSGDSMNDQDIFGLIFHPGFSTAKKVTDVSGRGVGMDVVKGVLDKLRGKVEVMSRMGEGTTILLKLPLTLAVIDGIIVKAGEQSYVVPTVSVLESIRPNKDDCHTVANKGEMIKIRGNLYPLVRLHDLFDFAPNTRNPWDAIVVIAESEGKQKCILVDEILGKQEVVIKSLSAMLKNVVGLAGGAILANGRVGMILDVSGIFSLAETQGGAGQAP
ncbi:MAG: chemotaxis protein CheA [Desulfatibacillum sp.]|nr:chemotaxis protein CheA [Desulfatibacillum sp.]